MRVPRCRRFCIQDGPERLFAKLEPGRRFRFARAAGATTVFGADPIAIVQASRADDDALPFDRLRAALPCVPRARRDGLFPGGAVGFLTYEAGDVLEGLPPRPVGPGEPPDLYFAVYDTFAVWRPGEDLEVVSWGLTDDGALDDRLALRRTGALEERLRGAAPAAQPAGRPATEPHELRQSLMRESHGRAVESLRRSIACGDVYQGNLTVRFDVPFGGEGSLLFETLLRENPAPFGALLEADDVTVVSSSPERMLRVDGVAVESRPIKGTAARDPDPAIDAARGRELLRSEKDRAELLMITDLVRHDLGKVCEYGTVRVPRLVELQSFPHLHHLVSTVTGRLRRGADVFDALRAVFPCGSITGAPKRRAMELLRELEPVARGVYTGTVGWVGFDRSADLNVAIRTGHLSGGRLSFGAGGAIVWDSRPDSEWDELLLKARAMRLALGVPLVEASPEAKSQ